MHVLELEIGERGRERERKKEKEEERAKECVREIEEKEIDTRNIFSREIKENVWK